MNVEKFVEDLLAPASEKGTSIANIEGAGIDPEEFERIVHTVLSDEAVGMRLILDPMLSMCMGALIAVRLMKRGR